MVKSQINYLIDFINAMVSKTGFAVYICQEVYALSTGTAQSIGNQLNFISDYHVTSAWMRQRVSPLGPVLFVVDHPTGGRVYAH